MQTKKRLLFSTLLILFFVANVHGRAQGDGHPESSAGLEQIKFGVRLCPGIFFSTVGGFVEYKADEAIGLQTGLLFFNDRYVMKSLKEHSDLAVMVTPNYLSVPLIARFYPGEGRQFCMFVGLQINYVTGGNIAYLGNNAEFEDFAKADKYAINDESQRRVTINNWGAHLLVGFDYEYLGGFQLGLEYGRGLSSLAKCGSEDFNWTFKPYLGYNFAKLFN